MLFVLELGVVKNFFRLAERTVVLIYKGLELKNSLLASHNLTLNWFITQL